MTNVDNGSNVSSYAPKHTLPATLKQAKQLAKQHFDKHISELFDSCDDLFYDLSSRSKNNQEQTFYFESMREIRVKRHEVLRHFQNSLSAGFVEAYNAKRLPSETNKLALVHHDELEINVALINMHGRAKDVYKDDLFDLSTRLNQLVPGANTSAESTPLSPEHLCRYFANACQQHIDISIKPLIILLKQFERYVLKRLGQIYSEINQLMIDSGIAPSIKRRAINSSTENASSSVQHDLSLDKSMHQTAEQHHRYGLPLARYYDNYSASSHLSEFSSLFGDIRKNGVRSAHYTPYVQNPGPIMPVGEFIRQLTEVQAELNDQESNEHIAPCLHKVTQRLLQQSSPEQPQALTSASDDIINLVAMFFEFILDDHLIDAAFRHQISRLQIPILKLAIKDASFFNNMGHPARHLINTIAAVGLTYEEKRDLSKDKIYHAIQDVVHTICHQRLFDDRIFGELLPKLEHIIDKEQHRSAIIEKRTSQTEIGKSQVKNSNKIARSYMVKTLRKVKLPGHIRDFLIERWLNVMIMTALKHTENSPQWREKSEAVNDLIWCCQMANEPAAQTRLETLIPKLLQELKTGLLMLGDDTCSVDNELSALKPYLQQTHPIDTVDPDATVRLARTTEPEGETAIERQQKQLDDLSPAAIKQLEMVNIGDWVRYKHPKTGKDTRCKLSAKIESTDTYLFVNRFGLKVLEIDRRSFAYDLHIERVTLIKNTPFFDKILNKMSSQLKQAST